MAITLSAGVRQALSALQSTQSDARVAQSRLATGKKVNSALDNPTSFFTASGLSNRANDLSTLLDGMGQGIKTLEAADKGIKSITKLVENAQSIAKQAQAYKIDPTNFTGAATTALNGTDKLVADLGFTAAKVITLDIDKGNAGAKTATLTIAATDTVDDLITKFNTADAGNVTAKLVGGQLSITDSQGRSIDLTTDDTDLSKLTGSTAKTQNVAASTDKRVQLQSDFDGIMTQIDQLAGDSSYNGVNLLTGDNLKVQFNESGKSKLDITGADLTSSGLKIDTQKLNNATNITKTLDALKTATDTLRSQASTFGANLSVVQNRQEFTKGMIDTLNNGSDELTIADTNQEGANLLALNTRAQLSQTALSLASQQDQAVLRLF